MSQKRGSNIISKIAAFAIVFILTSFVKVEAVELVGDINGDGKIDIRDLSIIVLNYNSSDGKCDLNKDGIVDIYDLVLASRSIDAFTVYDNRGSFSKAYSGGQIKDAIDYAARIGGSVYSQSSLVWDKSYYYVYDGESYISKHNTMYDAVSKGMTMKNGKVFSKQGVLILDKRNNYKAMVGVTQDDLDIRTAPSDNNRTGIDALNDRIIYVDARINGVNKYNNFKVFYKIRYYNNENKLLQGYVPTYIDFIQDDMNDYALGYLSEKEESNGDPGCISDNPQDIGGLSVGAWQLSAKMGSLGGFISWLEGRQPQFYKILNDAWQKDGGKPKVYGDNFKAAWKQVARDNFEEFYNIQKEYTKKQFYDPVMRFLKEDGYDVSELLQYNSIRNMFWSTGVQHGATGAKRIVEECKRSNETPGQYISRAKRDPIQFIDDIYEKRTEKIKASSNGPDVIKAVVQRFIRERIDCKRAYSRETTY